MKHKLKKIVNNINIRRHIASTTAILLGLTSISYGTLLNATNIEPRETLTVRQEGEGISKLRREDGSYIVGTRTPKKRASNGELVFCLEKSKATPSGQTFTKGVAVSPPIDYIVNADLSYLNDEETEWYMKQMAIYALQGQWNPSSIESQVGSSYKYVIDGIKQLVNNAKRSVNAFGRRARATIGATPSLQYMYAGSENYVTNLYKVDASGGPSNITVALTNAPNGSVIMDRNFNVITTVPVSDPYFRIAVPKSAVSGSEINVTAKVTATFKTNQTFIWMPPSNNVQQITLPGSGAPKVETAETEVSAKIVPGSKSGKIKKFDKDTGKPLAGAVFEIHLIKSGQEYLKGRVTTNDEGYAEFAFADGTYKITEVQAPPGYQIDVTPSQTITVNTANADVISVIFRNVGDDAKIVIEKIDGLTGEPLAGAEIGLLAMDYSSGTPTGQDAGGGTTGADGSIELTVKPGEYVVYEKKAPPGYELLADGQLVTLEPNETTTVVVENFPQTGNMVLKKIDAKTREPLPNAEFVITTAEGDYYTTEYSDSNGEVRLAIPAGDYIVQETVAPDGYVLNNEPHPFTVEPNGNVEIVIENRLETIEQVIKKVCAVTGNFLANAEFQITDNNGNNPVTVITNDKGEAKLELEPGDYILQEIKAPNNYVKLEEPVPFTVRRGQNNVLEIKNRPEEYRFRIKKIDADTKQPLVGAEFKLIKDDTGAELTATTNEQGEAEFTSMYGDYTLKEVKAPEGYILNTQEHKFTVNAENTEVSIEIPNAPMKGNVQIIKKDSETGEVIPNVTFGLFKGEEQIAESITNEQGVAVFTDILYGEYTIKETKPAEGYQPNTNVWNVSINNETQGTTQEFEILNDIIKGKIQIVKVDANDVEKPVKDAIFNLFKADDLETPIAELITDENGIATTGDLKYGDYVLQEKDAPDAYYINDKLYPVSIREHGKIEIQEIVNYPVEFILKILKIDGEKQIPLKGAKFQITQNDEVISFTYEKDGQSVTEDTFISNEQGEILLPSPLGTGEYKLIEVESPNGYLGIEPISFKVDRTTELEEGKILTIVVENFIIKGHVKLLKTDNKNEKNPLDGVKFELYKKATKNDEVEDTNPVEKLLSKLFKKSKTNEEKPNKDNSGENSNEENSEENSNEENSEENSNNNIGTTTSSTLAPNENLLTEEQKPLENGDLLIGVYATTKDGIVYVENLEYGDYYFKEIEPKEGFVLNETPLEFSVSENLKTIELSMENKPIEGSVIISKEDVSTGEKLPDTGIKIYGKDKETIIVEGRTDSEGNFEFGPLEYGDYYYQEFDAPPGYVIDESLFPFTVDEDGEIIKCIMTNKKIEGDLEITKSDVSDGTLLPNTTFAIYDSTGNNVVVKGKTDDNGIAKFKLPYGDYFYQEIQAPPGYLIDDTKFPFAIKENGEIVKAHMTNMKQPNAPETPISKIPSINTSLPKTGVAPEVMQGFGILSISVGLTLRKNPRKKD